jgi:hypothetical protein
MNHVLRYISILLTGNQQWYGHYAAAIDNQSAIVANAPPGNIFFTSMET